MKQLFAFSISAFLLVLMRQTKGKHNNMCTVHCTLLNPKINITIRKVYTTLVNPIITHTGLLWLKILKQRLNKFSLFICYLNFWLYDIAVYSSWSRGVWLNLKQWICHKKKNSNRRCYLGHLLSTFRTVIVISTYFCTLKNSYTKWLK